MYDFYKIFFVFQKKLIVKNKYFYPLSKNLILLEKSLCKTIHSLKQTFSVKRKFYFQFSFVRNEQV